MSKYMVRGQRSDTKPGKKPASAFANEFAARTNIERKLQMLQSFLKKDPEAEYTLKYPASVRQFNFWLGEPSGAPFIARNSQATLKRHPDLLASVVAATSSVKALNQTAADTSSTRVQRLASSRRAQALHKTLREIAERELVKARRSQTHAEADCEMFRQRLMSCEAEAAKLLKKQSEELALLKAEVADLTKTLARVRPLKKI